MSRSIQRVSGFIGIASVRTLMLFTRPLMAESTQDQLTLTPKYYEGQKAPALSDDGDGAEPSTTSPDPVADLINAPLLLSDEKEATTEETPDSSDRWNDYTDGWRLKFTPNLWGAGIEGSLGKRNREVNVDKSFSDLLKKLDGALALSFEVGNGPISGIFQGLYYRFKDDGSTRNGRFQAKAKLDMAIIDFGLAYRFLNLPLGADQGADTPRLVLEFVPGFRWTYADTDVDIYGGPFGGLHPSATKDFFDPYVGGRIRLDLNRHINFTVLGNVGGWGVGTELTYAVRGIVEYRFNPRWGVFAGYQLLYDKFDKNGADLDVTLQGPVVGLSVRW